MTRNKKNYLIYLCMLALFGLLIYGALKIGEKFDLSTTSKVSSGENAFLIFGSVVKDNLGSAMAILLVQIIVVLFAVRLFSFLFKYIGQPGVIGEIVAGIVLGPSLLGYFFPEIFGFLFPPESLTNLELISQLGLILFMFVIGMELDFGVIRKKINETLVISHAGILVPFFLGIVASYWIYEKYAATHTSFLPFALFIGISMSITAFPVLARIVQERGLTQTPTGILSIASAANDDVTAWCLLAVVIAIAKAGTFISALYAVGFTVLYILLMFYVVRPFLRKVGSVYVTGEVISKTFVSFIFLILVISATLTEMIGIHALFGAFIAGVVMPSNIGFRKVMMEKVEDVALVFFLPLFFAYTGLHTEIGLIDTLELWLICGLFILVAVVGKFGGCALAARLVGESWKNSLIVGTLMNTRGLMELVALNIGYEMGVLPPSVFVILVIMALVTTFMTTPMLSIIEKIFVKREMKESHSERLLFCFGRPESGRQLLEIYHKLFGEQLKESHVIGAHYTLGTDLNPVKAEQYAKESFELVNKEASKLHLSVDERYQVTDRLMQAIAQLSEDERVSLLLIGSGARFIEESAADRKPQRSIRSIITGLIRKHPLTLSGSLFREKADEIMGQVKTCPVAIFVNRTGEVPAGLSFLMAEAGDNFLLPYLRAVLQGNPGTVQLFINKEYVAWIAGLSEEYPERISLQEYVKVEELDFSQDRLLAVSYQTCAQLLDGKFQHDPIPSLLIIRPEIAGNS